MEDNSIDLTLTDIPYDGVNNVKESDLRKLSKGKADVLTFDLDMFLEQVYRVTSGTIIIFCNDTQLSKIMQFFRDKQNISKHKISIRQLVWAKINPSPIHGKYMYLSGCENAVWVRKKGATFNAHCKSNVFRHPCGRSKLHPTEKNHKLLKELILDNSNEGDIVFDPCAGSGAHLLCAKELGRNYVGCELDKEFYDIANDRLKDSTI